jgi:hypothetical protein
MMLPEWLKSRRTVEMLQGLMMERRESADDSETVRV